MCVRTVRYGLTDHAGSTRDTLLLILHCRPFGDQDPKKIMKEEKYEKA